MMTVREIFLLVLFVIWVQLIITFEKSRSKTLRREKMDRKSVTYRIISSKPYSLIASTVVILVPMILLFRVFSS